MAFAGDSAGAHGDGACNHDFNIPNRINSSICGHDSSQDVGSWSDAGGNCVRTSCDESKSPPVACLGDLDQSVEVNASDLGFLIGVGDTDGAIVEGSDFDGDDIVNSNDLGLLIGALVSCR